MKEYYQSSYRIMFDIMDGLVGFNVSLWQESHCKRHKSSRPARAYLFNVLSTCVPFRNLHVFGNSQ